MNEKECISLKFSEGLSIFDNVCRYLVIDEQEKCNEPTAKVKDIQGIQAHAGHNFFFPEGKKFRFNIDYSPYLHMLSGKYLLACFYHRFI